MEIKSAILRIAERKTKFKTSDLLNELEKLVSRQYLASILRLMVQEGKLFKSGSTKNAFYVLPKHSGMLKTGIKRRLKNVGLKEHEVFADIREHMAFAGLLKENVLSIFEYAFTEILNNAIEHSHSQHIEIEVNKKDNILEFVINDFGIGVFRSVMKKHKLDSELNAIQDLLKGKVTTQPKAHSGEGIFFTSKSADIFILESYGYRLRVDNNIPDIFVERLKPVKNGTRVIFTLKLDSKKHLSDIFHKFQSTKDSYAFDKTEIQVRLYTMGTIYISRSQARRILQGLDKFKLVILDFDRVPTIGQAFADEIFRVFKIKHPDIKIQPINMNEAVNFMIRRVNKPQES
jgi:anti-sigma regulatory factor (Ser/Thr protein kinase)